MSVIGVLLVCIFLHLHWIRSRKPPNADNFTYQYCVSSLILSETKFWTWGPFYVAVSVPNFAAFFFLEYTARKFFLNLYAFTFTLKVSVIINTTITVFSICTGNIARGLSTVQWPRVILPVQIEKTVTVALIARICLKLIQKKLNCLNPQKIRTGKCWK